MEKAGTMDVIDNAAAGRFEVTVEGSTAFAAYEINCDIITMTHTIVPPEIEGRGVASGLIAAALDDARAKGRHVVPQCRFVAAYITRHPAYGDLVAAPAVED